MEPHESPLLKVARLALVVCRRQLPDYAHPKSRRDFTQPQLMACLVVRAYRKLTYRATEELLALSPALRAALDLAEVPDHSTLQKFAARAAGAAVLERLVGQVMAWLREGGLSVTEVAVDSSGWEATCASAHFLSRSRRRRGGYVKVSLAVACGSVTLVAMDLALGPSNDLVQARDVLWPAAGRCRPDFVFLDAGYDAEWVHRFCRDGWGAASYLPPVPRARDGGVKTPYRGRRARYRPYHAGRRWHAESFISGAKRVCGPTLAARSTPALLTEAGLKVLAYAVHR